MNVLKKNMYKVNYTSVLSDNKKAKKIWTSLFKFVKNNKIIIVSLAIFMVAICFNFILLYDFFSILERIS